jgi:hypothetical protein
VPCLLVSNQLPMPNVVYENKQLQAVYK